MPNPYPATVNSETRALEHKQKNAFHAFQQYLDTELGQVRTEMGSIKANPALSGETKQIIERLQNQMSDVTAKMQTLQIMMNQPGNGGYDSPEVKRQKLSEERKTAFNRALKAGWGSLNEEERKHVIHDTEAGITTEYKAMYGADAQLGGFLAVPEYVDQLIQSIILVSPMNELVEVRYTSKPYVMTPKRIQTSTAVRVAEQAIRQETQNPKFGMVQTFPYESYAFSLISRTDLDDSEIDLAAYLMNDFSTQFAKLMGYEVINGSGAAASQCFGFLNDAGITSTATVTQNSGVLDYKSLVKLKQSLKPGYLPSSTWIWTNETLGSIQSLTDQQGRPLWVPFGGTLPETVFGRPYRIMPDMPQLPENGGQAGAYVIALGDWRDAYQLVIRKQVSMQVLTERFADQNAYGYYGYFRFGGTTKLAEAVKVLKVKP